MYPYPQSFPSEEVRILLPILRGQAPEVGEGIQAAWVVVGYGASQLAPAKIAPYSPASSKPLPGPGLVADRLEEAAKVVADGQPHTRAGVPWEIVLPVLYDLLRRWLESR